ncbi:MAG: DUF4493 domain-containing protein [Bacteroidales bacterium]|nr:DUF4493 domain-containing protein [Bacteroidales bacterium]
MKRTLKILTAGTVLAGALALSVNSCDISLDTKGESLPGSIRVHFNSACLPSSSKAEPVCLPDTNDFILKITSADGAVLYDGKFGKAPENIPAQPGSYTVSAYSRVFSEPAFASPQFGDEQVVIVEQGEERCVILECAQTNCGIKLIFDPAFRSEHPQGVTYISSADGKLMFGYGEHRVAYFKPGQINVTLAEDGMENVLFSRRLEAREILNVKISYGSKAGTASGIILQIDTARNWISDSYVQNEDIPGVNPLTALSVSEAGRNIGQKDVWVYGYIVGISTSSSKSVFEPPFDSATNLLLASRATVTDRQSCISVELAKGDVRDALNLKDNPEMLGEQVFLFGDIVESYYGLPGLKSVTAYREK